MLKHRQFHLNRRNGGEEGEGVFDFSEVFLLGCFAFHLGLVYFLSVRVVKHRLPKVVEKSLSLDTFNTQL